MIKTKNNLFVLIKIIYFHVFFIIYSLQSGHQLVKQVLQNGNCSPMIIRQVANFLCRGKLFDENGDLIKVKFKIHISSERQRWWVRILRLQSFFDFVKES